MVELENHQMIIKTIHPSGVEEWYCPTCGRRFLMQWLPVYLKVVLDPGVETAIHNLWNVDGNDLSSQAVSAEETILEGAGCEQSE
jgi:hypothetical protein